MKSFRHLFVLTIAAGIFSGCGAMKDIGVLPTDEPPGVGQKAERGYAASAHVLAALEEYRVAHGSYPEKLDALVPDYLPVVWTGGGDLDYSYSRSGDGYSFSFHYIGPGMNTCTIKTGEDWRCSGAY